MTHSVTCFKSSGFPLLPEITLKIDEQSQVVASKIPEGGQFANKGVKEGDIIVSVNGVSVEGFDVNKCYTTLSIITGEVNIVFSTPGTSVAELSDKTDGKTRSGVEPEKDFVEEPTDPKPNEPLKKEAEHPKQSMKMNRKGIESFPQEKNTTYYRFKPKVQECPKCDETFNGIKTLCEHYKKVHTIENDDKEVQEISVTSNVVDLPEVKKISAKVTRNLLKEVDAKSVNEMGDINDVKQQLQIITDKYAVAEKENSKKREQIIKLNEGMELIKEKFANSKKERMELSEINSELETSLRTLKDDVDVKYQEIFDLNRVVLKTEENLDIERKSNQKEKDRIKVLTEEIKKLKKALKELNKKHEESEERNKKEMEKSANQQHDNVKVSELDKELEILQSKTNKFTSENESLVEETLEVSKKEKEVLQNVIDQKIVEVEKLKSEKSLSKLKIRDLEKQMDAFKTSAEDITAKISEIDNERYNDRNNLISTMEAQKKKIDELVKEKDYHKERANKYKKKYKSDAAKLLEKITRKEDKIDELKNTEKPEQSLTENTMEAEEKNLMNLPESEVRTMKSANEVNVEKIISLETEINSSKNGKKGHEFVYFKTDLGELEKDLSELGESLKSLVNLKDKLKMKKKRMETEFDTLNKEKKSLKGEVCNMSQIHNLVDKFSLQKKGAGPALFRGTKRKRDIRDSQRSGGDLHRRDEDNDDFQIEGTWSNNIDNKRLKSPVNELLK